MHESFPGKINKLDKYKNFLQELKSLLDEQIDYNLYEERIWEIFGISAYIGHTMDIIISSAVDQVSPVQFLRSFHKLLNIIQEYSYNCFSLAIKVNELELLSRIEERSFQQTN